MDERPGFFDELRKRTENRPVLRWAFIALPFMVILFAVVDVVRGESSGIEIGISAVLLVAYSYTAWRVVHKRG